MSSSVSDCFFAGATLLPSQVFGSPPTNVCIKDECVMTRVFEKAFPNFIWVAKGDKKYEDILASLKDELAKDSLASSSFRDHHHHIRCPSHVPQSWPPRGHNIFGPLVVLNVTKLWQKSTGVWIMVQWIIGANFEKIGWKLRVGGYIQEKMHLAP